MSSLVFSGRTDTGTADGGSDILVLGQRKMLPKPQLLAFVQGLTGLLTTSVVWEKDPQPFISDRDRAKITCMVRSIKTEGWDNQVQSFGQAANNDQSGLAVQSVGRRSFVLSLRCEAFDYQVEAGEVLDAIRTRL